MVGDDRKRRSWKGIRLESFGFEAEGNFPTGLGIAVIEFLIITINKAKSS